MRYSYVDNAKGLAMLLVIWAHCNSSGPLATFAYSFHMPVFFVISGLMYKPDKYSSFWCYARSQFNSLLVPYVVYSVLWWAVWALYSCLTHAGVDNYFWPLFQTVIAQGSQNYLVHNTALWFVPCLVAVKLLYYFIGRLPIWLRIACCFVLAFLNIQIIENIHPLWGSLPWNFDTALMALPFYCIGNLFGEVGHSRIMKYVGERKIIMSVLCVAIFGGLLYSAFEGGARISMGHSYYGPSIVMFYIKAISGSCALILLSMLLTPYLKLGFINRIGLHSFDYMSTNVPIKGFIIVIYCRLLGISQMDVWTGISHSLVPFFITLLICTLLSFAADYIRKKIYA